MLRTIHLYGDLEEQFGKTWEMDVASVGEAIRALTALTKGKFLKAINPQGKYRVVRGDDLYDEKAALTDDTIKLNFKKGDFHICPVPAGGGPWVRIVLGVVLIVVGIIYPAIGAYTIPMGIGLVMGGIIELLTPVPKTPDYGTREKPDERPSFIFDGPTNTIEQGGALPLVYGRMRLGSTVVSSALDVEDII